MDHAILAAHPTAAAFLRNLNERTLLFSELEGVLQSPNTTAPEVVAACWLLAKLCHFGIWPEHSRAVILRCAIDRLRPIAGDADTDELLDGDDELASLSKNCLGELIAAARKK